MKKRISSIPWRVRRTRSVRRRKQESIGLFLLTMLSLIGAPARAAVLGDIDGDGRVTVRDVVRLVEIVARGDAPSSRELLFGDVSPSSGPGASLPSLRTFGDGRISQEDVAALLRCVLGLQKEREVGAVAFTLAGSGPTTHLKVKEVAAQDPQRVTDGRADEIYLFDPWDLALAPTGEIYFTEYIGNRVRVLDKNGYIRTLAGSLESGYIDHPADRARFDRPAGLALLPNGSLVVADSLNNSIRQISPQGVVTTLAGNGRPGDEDGRGTLATFRTPSGVAVDPSGNVYVADTDNSRIRRIDPAGRVTTLAGSLKRGTNDGPALEARFNYPTGVCYDPRDRGLFIADMANHKIRKLTSQGQVITVAGSGAPGHLDGDGPAAQFKYPYGVDLDSQGRLWIADWLNQSVRILYPDGRVDTVAGRLPESYRDGSAGDAKFKGLMNVRVAQNGLIYLADTDNQRIRVLAP